MNIGLKNDKGFSFFKWKDNEKSTNKTRCFNGRYIEDETFLDIDRLCIEDAVFENCIFENCQELSFESCQMKNCTFKNVCSVEGMHTNFYGCFFLECCSDGPLLTIDSHGQAKGCKFETVTSLGDQGYVIYSVYGKKQEVAEVEDCTFIDCRVESEDGRLCYCAYFKPLSSFNTVSVDNVDYATCSFRDCGALKSQK